ncbi:MAG: hypothetical protein MSB10_01150, partial [Clostridiales bacterium]|nr:hypothetical protein [Clostridiales bacterium]
MKQTRTRLGSLFIVVTMLLTILPVSAFAAEDKDAYSSLKAAIEAVPTDGTETTVTMTSDIAGMTTEQIITIQEGQNIVLDMAGHCITVAPDNFNGRPIVNYGTLTIKGNGTIDSSMATSKKNGTVGMGAIDNFGTLLIENGTYKGCVFGGAAIRNKEGASLTIEDGYFESNSSVYNFEGATAIINGGEFKSEACNAIEDDTGTAGHFAYAFISAGNLYFNNGKVTGVQGALAINNGYAEVKNGTFETVLCDHGSNTPFYALYIAGERGVVDATISGGTFKSATRVAVSVGNDNTGGDGGLNLPANATITGGTFIGGGSGTAALEAPKTGTLNITAGTFSSDVSDYVDRSSSVTTDAHGNFVILPNEKEDGVAEIDGKYYKTLGDALASAADGDTIKLLKNVDSNTAITIPAGVTLDGAGKALAYTGGSKETPSDGAFITAGGENVTIRNLTIETNNQIKHGVQFYCVTSGKLSGITVNGGAYTSVIVNNSQNIILENCVLNSNGYTNIEYAVGSNISDVVIPSLTVDNVTFKPAGETGAPLMIWVDKDTVGRIKPVIGGNPTDEDVVAKIKESVTNKDPGDVVISVELSDGSVENETVSGVGYPTGSTTYAITVDKADNGAVTASRTRASRGLTITLTVKPDEGYKLDDL